jgi:predicted kinase
MELVILIGLQGAGKSTFRRARFDATHQVVSKDHFRNNSRPSRRQEQLLRQALDEGKSVVVDNTNVQAEDRAALLGLAREYGIRCVCYWLRSTVEESLARNATRAGKARVPDKAVLATARRFVPPSWAEGFDELYEVRSSGDMSHVITAAVKEAE